MPIIKSNYKPALLFRSMDIATIYSAKFRKLQKVKFKRERITLPDGDFLDIDWLHAEIPTDKCIILLHGLEGSTDSQYIHAMARLFNKNNYDVCAVNFRSCSGELNNTFGCYHSGRTEDIEFVLKQIADKKIYKNIALQGVSLGGNIALKLTGENNNLPEELKAVVAISTPCDLAGSSQDLTKARNVLYAKQFDKSLMEKVKAKQKAFPDQLSEEEVESIKSLRDFDEIYTAKAHGFDSAEDYYEQSSSLNVLEDIKIPTLILNAENDSFLSKESYPYDIARKNPNLFLEVPKYGGHVGFYTGNELYYHEKRTLEFVSQYIS